MLVRALFLFLAMAWRWGGGNKNEPRQRKRERNDRSRAGACGGGTCLAELFEGGGSSLDATENELLHLGVDADHVGEH